MWESADGPAPGRALQQIPSEPRIQWTPTSATRFCRLPDRAVRFPRRSVLLRRGALDVRRPRTLRAVGNLELDSITLAQICDALAIDSTLVKEIFLARLTLDEPKAFVHSQRPNCSCHLSISDLWFLTIAVDFNSTDGMTCLVDSTFGP